MTVDEEFSFSIAYGLWLAMRKKVPIDDCRAIADRVMAYMKLSGWTWKRRDPREPN